MSIDSVKNKIQKSIKNLENSIKFLKKCGEMDFKKVRKFYNFWGDSKVSDGVIYQMLQESKFAGPDAFKQGLSQSAQEAINQFYELMRRL